MKPSNSFLSVFTLFLFWLTESVNSQLHLFTTVKLIDIFHLQSDKYFWSSVIACFYFTVISCCCWCCCFGRSCCFLGGFLSCIAVALSNEVIFEFLEYDYVLSFSLALLLPIHWSFSSFFISLQLELVWVEEHSRENCLSMATGVLLSFLMWEWVWAWV